MCPMEDKIGAGSKRPGRNTNRVMQLWRDVVLAVRGSEQDFTEGGLGRAILLLSIPMCH